MIEIKRNKKYNNIILKLLIVLVILNIILSFTNIGNKSYARRRQERTLEFDSVLIENIIRPDGTIEVTETINVTHQRYNTVNRVFGKGVTKENVQNVKVYDMFRNELKMNEVLEKQQFGYYHFGEYNGNLEYGIGLSYSNYKKKEQFVIKYDLKGAITKYQDKTEIYYKPIDAKMNAPINDFEFDIYYDIESKKVKKSSVYNPYAYNSQFTLPANLEINGEKLGTTRVNPNIDLNTNQNTTSLTSNIDEEEEKKKFFKESSVFVNYDPYKTGLIAGKDFRNENKIRILKDMIATYDYDDDKSWNGGFYEYRIFADNKWFEELEVSQNIPLPYSKIEEQEAIQNKIKESRERIIIAKYRSNIIRSNGILLILFIGIITLILIIIKKVKNRKNTKKRYQELGAQKYFTDIPSTNLNLLRIARVDKKVVNIPNLVTAVILKLVHLKIFTVEDDLNAKRIFKGIFDPELKYKKLYKYNNEKYEEIKSTLDNLDKEIYLYIRAMDKNKDGHVTEDELTVGLKNTFSTKVMNITKQGEDEGTKLENLGILKKKGVKKNFGKVKTTWYADKISTVLFILILLIGITCFILNSIWYIKVFSLFAISMLIFIPLIIFNESHPYEQDFTDAGIKVKSEIMGLKNHLNDFSLINELDEKSVIVWEKYLIYATIFGISKKVLENIKNKFPNIEDDLDIANVLITTKILNTSFSSTVNSAAVNSNSGYSGGSFGGRRFRWWRIWRKITSNLIKKYKIKTK